MFEECGFPLKEVSMDTEMILFDKEIEITTREVVLIVMPEGNETAVGCLAGHRGEREEGGVSEKSRGGRRDL